MKASPLSTSNYSLSISPPSLHRSTPTPNPNPNPSLFNPLTSPPKAKPLRLTPLSSSNSPSSNPSTLLNPIHPSFPDDNVRQNQWIVQTRNAPLPPFVSTWIAWFSLADRFSFLLAFLACSTSAAFTGFVIAAVPTLLAMGRAATSLAKLADAAPEELPITMAAVRLSSMEISDLTLELSDLSEEISEGISKSTQAVQAAEAGIKQIGAAAHQQTMSLIQERANLPVISLQPVVSGAAKKTSQAVGTATRTIMSIFSREESNSASFDDDDAYDGKDG